ncbi:FtsK/SpoIIIE domain-containing protein [Mycobacteroides abscessus]|uniref:FtsK/SpoIIIE domain-containing protein n=1 Tax=Mycobacteroides abscessus TaxID=36809 RepID=UPI0009258881|nr:FtsK/SpoIIIE domain-containing protein [Mycobacteroides abscessus]SIG31785.1 ftsk/SpoIIIE family protein, putative [Mycobacteroides abscessus subsp. abscessus]SIG43913.1 ftsk/SpoIIIE family protein, putative [Mycobacteroides abscessus subsp. abscessus]SIM97851.1 ftsk/SpoIIIE family protein, putative [Mycobacteroides abscessus subsp. abscessus]SIN10902.1 ftsk/SpoIIIE family protein, putative [Mycobacteroides abscessus subsp. abscessus]SIN14907.1 ftsk/SpoIIIE family protein, putative [Mycobac
MITNTNATLTVPIGSTPDGDPIAADLRRHPNLMLAGNAGCGKSTLLRQMAGALERQVGSNGKVLLVEGIYAGVDDFIAEVYEELLRSQSERTPDPERGPVVLCIDDFGVYAEHRMPPETLTMLRRIANTGRASDVHLLLATQSTVGINTDLLMAMSARIVMGTVTRHVGRMFSDVQWLDVAAEAAKGDRFSGLFVGSDGQPTAFTPLLPETFAAAVPTTPRR